MSIAEAVKKCTLMPAERLGLKDRGLLIPGYHADIVVFDENKIIDTATFAQPHQFAAGINQVIVNGVLTIAGGKPTGKMGGGVIRRG